MYKTTRISFSGVKFKFSIKTNDEVLKFHGNERPPFWILLGYFLSDSFILRFSSSSKVFFVGRPRWKSLTLTFFSSYFKHIKWNKMKLFIHACDNCFYCSLCDACIKLLLLNPSDAFFRIFIAFFCSSSKLTNLRNIEVHRRRRRQRLWFLTFDDSIYGRVGVCIPYSWHGFLRCF